MRAQAAGSAALDHCFHGACCGAGQQALCEVSAAQGCCGMITSRLDKTRAACGTGCSRPGPGNNSSCSMWPSLTLGCRALSALRTRWCSRTCHRKRDEHHRCAAVSVVLMRMAWSLQALSFVCHAAIHHVQQFLAGIIRFVCLLTSFACKNVVTMCRGNACQNCLCLAALPFILKQALRVHARAFLCTHILNSLRSLTSASMKQYTIC